MPTLNEGRFGNVVSDDNVTVEGWSDDVELVCRNIEHNSIELSKPAVAFRTNINVNNSGRILFISACSVQNINIYDGITFYIGLGTITGTVRVYGYNN